MPNSSLPHKETTLLMDWQARCHDCGSTFSLHDAVHRCPECKGPLDLLCDYEELSRFINQTDWRESNLRSSKYWRALPLGNFTQIVSLQEGMTPLKPFMRLGEEQGMSHVWAKLESENPTGCFKDRGSLLEISWAVQHGYKAVVCASTGNMAGSVAAYAAKAGLECYIFVPEGVPIGKLSMILAFCAKPIAVRGSYNDCVRLAEFLASEEGYFLAGDYALRAEGSKTQAYEIIEQLHWNVPDWVAVPMGNGTNISGIAKGFKDLFSLGLIDRLPRLLGVQAARSSPIVQAWERKEAHVVAVEALARTVAQAANVGNPLDATKALSAIRESDGAAIAVSEEEILYAQEELSRMESVFVEPSSALVWAGVKRLKEQGTVNNEQRTMNNEQTIVLVLTGHGLKDPKSVLVRAVEPPIIAPTVTALKELWKEKLYALTKVSAAQGDAVIWGKDTIPYGLAAKAQELFHVVLDHAHAERLAISVAQFHEKMREMTLHSFNLLLEDVTKLPYDYTEILRIADFTIHVPRHAMPRARVSVKLNGGAYEGEYEGVGPVDAVIKGAEEALAKSQHGIPHALVDYDVEIDRGGTDAIVRVHLALEHPSGAKVTGSAVSPDVITASVVAFERAYNLLYQKVRQVL
ncbi:MAG: threonine synthase [Patescibacteria group bacterium]